MISVERALNSIRGKSVEEIREFARNRISGTDIASFGSGHSTEPSEDVVIQLLGNPGLDAEKRKAVVEGWSDVYLEIRKWLDSPDWTKKIDKWKNAFVNLCRVVDIAEPPEFKKYVKRVITELLDEESCPGELLGAAVKAYMAYAQDEKSIRFWEDEILKNKDVAAYGFNALLDINARHARIEEKLCELWRLQVEENWPVNTAFLMRRAARVRNETALINRVLLKLKKRGGSLWEKIEKELKQPWSQQWLEKLKELEQSVSPKASRKVSTAHFITVIPAKAGIQKSILGVKSRFFSASYDAALGYERASKEEITPAIKRRRQQYLPEVEFEHGIGEDQAYYGFVKIRSELFDTDWVYSIGRLVQKLESKKKIKSVDFEKESEEIIYASKVG